MHQSTWVKIKQRLNPPGTISIGRYFDGTTPQKKPTFMQNKSWTQLKITLIMNINWQELVHYMNKKQSS